MCARFSPAPPRILVVDDDIDLLMLMERRLDREGYVVETAVSISEAEEILPSFQPQLLLLDININGEDGRSLCFKLKHTVDKPPHVVMMSGYDFSPLRAKLFGADDLLAKPFAMDYALQKINHFVQFPSVGS